MRILAEVTIFLAVSMGASTIGSICGLGGGIIIKPLLDAMKLMSVEAVSFLSGCTVLAMAVSSVLRSYSRGDVKIDVRASTPLALGAVAGGILGQAAFQALKSASGNIALVGAAQSLALFGTTLASLLYTANEEKIKTRRTGNAVVGFLSGVALGVIASFIGIGGGPINIMVLSYFFSMKTKQAAINSLYVVMFAQTSSTLHVLVSGAVPDFPHSALAAMIAGGIAGAMIGGRINKKISSAAVRRLYMLLMGAIIFISIYNFVRFAFM